MVPVIDYTTFASKSPATSGLFASTLNFRFAIDRLLMAPSAVNPNFVPLLSVARPARITDLNVVANAKLRANPAVFDVTLNAFTVNAAENVPRVALYPTYRLLSVNLPAD